MNRTFFIGGMLSIVLLYTQCTNLTVLRTREIRKVNEHADSISLHFSQQLEQLFREQERLNELLRLVRADQQVRFNELIQTIDALKAALYDNQARLSKIDEKTYEMHKRWREQIVLDSLKNAAKNDELQKSYDAAFEDFSNGKYSTAIVKFENFVRNFAESPLIEEAVYWIGECYIADNSLSKAEQQFKLYMKQFPQGKKICESLYKLGLVYEKTKRDKAKSLVWEKLVTQCPESEYAKIVKNRN